MKKIQIKTVVSEFRCYLSVGDIIELTGEIKSFYCGIKYEFIHKTGDYCDVGFIQECEFNNPDFWELIEEREPLLVTDDGVGMMHSDQPLWGVIDFEKVITRVAWVKAWDKCFAHEKNADEYIWRNKPLFSYEEIAERASQTELYYLETLAKERIEE